jgi:hypothetical protein
MEPSDWTALAEFQSATVAIVSARIAACPALT